MSQTIVMNKLLKELNNLKREVLFIKKRLLNPNIIMAKEEAARVEQSMNEFNGRKTIPLFSVKKQLGL